MDDALAQPAVAEALGRVLATIESSIIRWERGSNNVRPESEENEDSGKESIRFSFLLRPRLSRQLLDQIIEEYNDLEEEDEKVLSSIDEKRSRLPRLRDLAIDPATLCKAAGGFAKLAASHPVISGSSTLTRVILKLLTSKNGRLIQEFSLADLIRACEAAAINDALGRGEDPVVGHFARRFLQLLNQANHSSKSDEKTHETHLLKLSSASPEEAVTLIWSLGELGATHLASDKDWQSAHRKLRLVMDNPLLTEEQLQHLSFPSVLKVVSRLV
jgi:hypothetical protein